VTDTATSTPPIAQLLDAIALSPPLPELLERILDAACRLTHADTGVIGLYDTRTDCMRTAALRNIAASELGSDLKRGEGLGGEVLASGRAVQRRYGDLPRPRATTILEHEALGLPIRWGDTLLGYFGVSIAPPRRFRGAQLELLELLARIAAHAIDNAYQKREAQRRTRRFELIARIAAGTHQDADVDTVLQRAADAIHELLQYPNVDIPLIDPAEPNTLVIRIRGGSYKQAIPHEDRIPIATGIMGAAVREKRAQLVNDVRGDPRYVCPPNVTPAGAELAIPLICNDQVVGVLNVEGEQPFGELDCLSLEVVADYLAVAINNARRFEQAHAGAVADERQRLARELHDNVTQILSSISLLTQTLASAWRRDPAEGERRVARLHQLAQTAFAEMRMLLRELSPPELPAPVAISRKGRAFAGLEQLKQHALTGALSRLLTAMVPEGLDLRMDFGGYTPQKIDHEEILFRVCQEALSNVVRHAGARRLLIEAAVTSQHAVLRVIDDGRGIGQEFRPGLGLSSMRARVEGIGGHLRVTPNSPRGTMIEARVPRSDRTIAAE
jgi:signal transduction histidine kinase